MNTKFKLAAYALLLLLAAWFGWGFHSNYATVTHESAAAATNETTTVATNNPVEATNTTADSSTNAVGDNAVENSNVVTSPSNSAPAAQTNAAATATAAVPPSHDVHGTMIAYLAALVGVVIGLGLLVAHDVTQYLGGVAVDTLLDDRGEAMRDPEYERAEQAWADGKHLEAIRMMREFLKKNPREQYAALRIAEIYEKDLKNPLAAALEYEEVLKENLEPERWGWAAVHLCNLYSKLGQQEKSRNLLKRIADDYPHTAAARKARTHLGLAELESESAESGKDMKPAAETQPAPDPSETPSKSNLPPGFRPRK